MNFLKPWRRWYCFFQVFLLSHLCSETVRGCVSLKIYKFQGKAVEVTVNNKKENKPDSNHFCWGGGGGGRGVKNPITSKNSASVVYGEKLCLFFRVCT
jgi:hypothetical protein